ncbi:sulfotransferase family protein [Sphingomonas parva]|uniref:Sulfotransferase family protein n=1 Tax=Sphingomonas parva TaxID=2555898 RepID=A0A4Y8ZRV6_9SPHN|nr:sulfotransferase [Sphingomonas parva]TFI58733.1 sulfotransferase family protein [Sphingomonas parva]
MVHARRLLREDPRLAALQAREIVRAAPADAEAWRLLGRALRAAGEQQDAEAAELEAIAVSVHDPRLFEAASALLDGRLAVAERLLRPHLKEKPTDVAAIRMMAELAARLGRLGDAEALLRRALELAPAFAPARSNLATVLYRQNRPAEAVEMLDLLLGADPANPAHQNLKAAALGRIGSYEEALGIYEQVLAGHPAQPKVWMSYGHVLKTVGRRDDSIAAYRRALSIAPTLGEVWWSLANLKTVRLGEEDVAAMEAALEADDLDEEDRFHLDFALGKALEDLGRDASAFAHYAEGNRLRRARIEYDPDEVSGHVDRCEALFTADFLEARGAEGCPAPDPIFVLGMPRAGSTLIEQILASHSEVEGTMELPDLPALAKRLGGTRQRPERGGYPDCLARLSAEELRGLGEEYLARTRVQRKTDRPFFIDKMPNNWAHVGLIRLILPNARIIDARRHPLACCFSNFKQHFARGQGFAYDQRELGRYYRDYVRLLAHFDAVMPGHVHRVLHERLIDDPEAEIRRLLAFLDLPFDGRCLRFHETERAVRTASSEQVRRPINREGVDQWRRFEPVLEPLKEALGPVLAAWPAVPGEWQMKHNQPRRSFRP